MADQSEITNALCIELREKWEEVKNSYQNSRLKLRENCAKFVSGIKWVMAVFGCLSMLMTLDGVSLKWISWINLAIGFPGYLFTRYFLAKWSRESFNQFKNELTDLSGRLTSFLASDQQTIHPTKKAFLEFLQEDMENLLSLPNPVKWTWLSIVLEGSWGWIADHFDS